MQCTQYIYSTTTTSPTSKATTIMMSVVLMIIVKRKEANELIAQNNANWLSALSSLLSEKTDNLFAVDNVRQPSSVGLEEHCF